MIKKINARDIILKNALKLLKQAGWGRIDVVYDLKTKRMSGMVFSKTKYFTNEYFSKVLTNIK